MSEPIEITPLLNDERVDRVVALVSGHSRSEVSALIDAGGVRLDGVTVTSRHRKVRAGEILEVAVTEAVAEVQLEAAAAGSVPFTVVFVDDSIIVVDKPAGVVVHPGAGHRADTLAAALIGLFPDLVEAARAGAGEQERPGIVHRLDKDTSGLLVVARTPDAYRSLRNQFTDRTIGREYRALALGSIAADEGIIEAPIGRSLRDPTKMAVRPAGREARTRYRVEERFSGPPATTLLTAMLDTGRTHQIRVHLRAIGHSVAGDRRYGGARSALPLKRPFLHAERLRLIHPSNGEEMQWEAALPADLESVLATLRATATQPLGSGGGVQRVDLGLEGEEPQR